MASQGGAAPGPAGGGGLVDRWDSLGLPRALMGGPSSGPPVAVRVWARR